MLMMDYAATKAPPEGVISTLPSPSRQWWGMAEATKAKAMSFSPPPTTGEVDRLYHQLEEIHAISTTQLVECTHWHCSDFTPSPVRARTGRWRPDKMPYVRRRAPPLPIDFSPQALLWQQGPHAEPTRQARRPSGAHGALVTVSLVEGGNPAMTLGDKWLGFLEAVRAVHH
jgi:hypothetical protein